MKSFFHVAENIIFSRRINAFEFAAFNLERKSFHCQLIRLLAILK